MQERQDAGFSIIEVMVVISITILLSVLTLGYNRSSEKQILLFRDQTYVVSVLNRAKALTIEKFVEVGTGQATTTCAFGVRFSELTNSFSLYRDVHINGCDNIDIDADGYGYDSGVDGEFLETFTLDQRSSFNLLFDGGTVTDDDIDIAFVSPHLEVFASHTFPITIGIESGDTAVKVNVSGSGQIITID